MHVKYILPIYHSLEARARESQVYAYGVERIHHCYIGLCAVGVHAGELAPENVHLDGDEIDSLSKSGLILSQKGSPTAKLPSYVTCWSRDLLTGGQGTLTLERRSRWSRPLSMSNRAHQTPQKKLSSLVLSCMLMLARC